MRIRPVLEASLIGLMVFLTALAGIWLLGFQSLSAQKESVREDLLRLACAAAGLVDGELHERITSPGQQESDEYRRALEPLVKFHKGVPQIAYLYTLVERQGRFHFILDTATAADRLGFNREMQPSGVMEPYQSHSIEEDRAEMEALRLGITFVSEQPFSDEFGTFLTALAPVKTADGKTVAVVGVDLNVSDYLIRLQQITLASFTSSIFALLASLVLGICIYRIRKRLGLREQEAAAAEAEKEALKEQDRRLVSALGEMVYHYDASSGKISWRGGCEAILGLAPDEMPRSPEQWKELVHQKDFLNLEPWTRVCEGTEDLLVREYRCLHKEGHSVWVSDRCVLTRNPDGGLASIDGVLLDISRRKKFESDLIGARDAAEAAARVKSDFLAVMSHEIRTPMNGVIGCTNLLLETSLNGEQRGYLQTIRKCGDSLLNLITDILDFSKMDSDKLSLESRPFSLRLCVQETLDLYGLMAAEKSVELLARFERNDLDWILGDEMRLRQVMVNLIGNALKFTSSGEVVVTLGRRPWLPGGDALMLSVRDTGIGIPRSKQPGIFLPFSQGDSSATRRFGGTGLGLAICGRLATLMGGAITVHSEEGKGSEFVVLIPLQEVPERNEARIPGPLQNRSVLVLDDCSSFRQMIQGVLEGEGMRVSAAGDPQTARIDLDPAGLPDVILLDTGLPELFFDEISQAVKNRPAGGPKIVGLVAPTVPRPPLPRGLDFAATVEKPVHIHVLLDLLASFFSPRAPQPAEPPAEPAEPLGSRYPLSILVVEDNEINRKVVIRMLEHLGYKPQTAVNGKICVERLQSESFDMVIMDVQMPEMDGCEATKILRARGDTTWITALTADAMPEDSLRCRVAGMNDYMSKPIRMDTLSAAIERCALARKKLRVV